LCRLAAGLAGAWAGAAAATGLLAAPLAFDLLPRADAGRFVARLFALDAYVGLALGLLLFMVAMQIARLAAETGQGSRFSTDMLLALAALFCVVAGHFGLQPLMQAARQGGAVPSFAAIHGAALVFFLLKLVAAAALAWRLSGADVRAAGPTS